MSDQLKHWFDLASLATIVSSFFDFLPHVAALLSVIWGVLRLWEIWTGKTIADRRKIRASVPDERRTE